MSFALGNRAKETSTTTGTGVLTLAGAAAGFVSLATELARQSGDANGPWRTTYLAFRNTDWEVGTGIVTAGSGGGSDTLTRETVSASTNGNAAVNWPAGAKTILIAPAAESLALLPYSPFLFGMRADGVTDDADALEKAINNANGRTVHLPARRIYISRPLIITAEAFHLRGEKSERGQPTLEIDHAGTIIDASDISAGQWVISRFETSSPAEVLGPFVIENLGVELGAANGFEFGRADLAAGSLDRADYDTLTDASGQRYIFAVQIRNVRIIGDTPNRVSDENGVLTRSGQRLIMITKGFECTIENLSTRGGDIAIETWGADCMVIDNVRLNHCHIPIVLQRSGFFGAVQNRVTRFQSEHYTFGCIIADSVAASISDYRCEANVNFGGAPYGHGRFNLTSELGITCAIVADDDPDTAGIDITFSEDMTGIVHPYASLLRVFDGSGNSEYVWPIAVNGTKVTVWSLGLAFDWSAASASVERIHGYSIFGGGTYNIILTGGDPEAYLDCPTYVYLRQSGSMYVQGSGKNPGTNTPTGNEVRAVVVGNRGGISPNFNSGLYMTDVASSLAPEPHPAAWHADYPAQKGWFPQNAGFRMARRSAPDEIADVPGFRQWAFTPDGYSITTDNLHERIVRKVAGDTDTQELHSVWEIPTTGAATFYSKTIPSQARGTMLEVIIVARARSSATTMTWQVLGVGGSAAKSVDLTTDWAIVRVPYNGVPTQWGTGRTGNNAGVRVVAGDEDIQVRAVFVRERPVQDLPTGYLSRASWREFLAISGGPPKTSGATALAVVRPVLGSPNNARLLIEFAATPRGGTQGYTWVSGEYVAHLTTFSGTAGLSGAVVERHKSKVSINAAVLELDVTITVSGSGSDLTILANVSLTGSSASGVSEVIAYLDVTALGEAVEMAAA